MRGRTKAAAPSPDAAIVEAARVAAARKATVDAICEAISRGELVQDACRDAEITRTTLFRWCEASDDLRNAYAHAREQQAHAIAEEAIAIADGTDDETVAQELAVDAYADSLKADPNARQKVAALEAGIIQRARIRVDARKWLASKIAPRSYGERLTHEGDPAAPIQHEHRVMRWGAVEIPL